MICAGGFRDACLGDSGGPLTCSKDLGKRRQQRYLCGIVSYGVDCQNPHNKDYPGVYTDVGKYKDWIEESQWRIKKLKQNTSAKTAGNFGETKSWVVTHIYFSFRTTCQGLFRRGGWTRHQCFLGIRKDQPHAHTRRWRPGRLDHQLDHWQVLLRGGQ